LILFFKDNTPNLQRRRSERRRQRRINGNDISSSETGIAAGRVRADAAATGEAEDEDGVTVKDDGTDADEVRSDPGPVVDDSTTRTTERAAAQRPVTASLPRQRRCRRGGAGVRAALAGLCGVGEDDGDDGAVEDSGSRGRAAPVQPARTGMRTRTARQAPPGGREAAGLPRIADCRRLVADEKDDSEASKGCCMSYVHTC
jgi:hypothetical protein